MVSKTKKNKSASLKPASQTEDIPKTTLIQFPLAKHASLVGTHALSLIFTLFFLPRSNHFGSFTSSFPSQPQSSQDKPQHPFLAPLTASPIRTLVWLCLGSGTVTMWGAGSLRAWRVAASASRKKKEPSPVAETQRLDGRTKPTMPEMPEKLLAVKNALIATLCGTVFFEVVLLCFGAPILSYAPQTLLLAILLSFLTIYTPAYALGIPSLTSSDSSALMERLDWVRLFSEFSPRLPLECAVVYPAIGAVIGCWLGAFPLPLDWDRPWQAWPLVPAYTAVLGHIVGAGYSLLLNTVQHVAAEEAMHDAKLQ